MMMKKKEQMLDQVFSYDPNLLDACASSLPLSLSLSRDEYYQDLALPLVLLCHDNNHDNHKSTSATTLSNVNVNVVVVNGSNFSSLSSLSLPSCGFCWSLFQQYTNHYYKDYELGTQSRESIKEMAQRLRHFLASVQHVYQHNHSNNSNNNNNNYSLLFHVTLNRFSDQAHHVDDTATATATATADNRRRRLIGHGSWNKLNPSTGNSNADKPSSRTLYIPSNDGNDNMDEEHFLPRPFESYPIMHSDGYNNKNRQHMRLWDGYVVQVDALGKKHQTETSTSTTTTAAAAATPSSSSSSSSENTRTADAVPGDYKHSLNWATTDNPDGVAIVHPAVDQGSCGSCWALAATGSLEASAARRAGYDAYQEFINSGHLSTPNIVTSYDGSIRKTSKQELNDQSNEKNDNGDMEELLSEHQLWQEAAISYAQAAERDAIQHCLNLSIQELIDCDTSVDRGCTGGNPLLAFHFIHRYGLVDWSDYPYVGRQQDKCMLWQDETNYKDNKINNDDMSFDSNGTFPHPQPVATVQSWGILEPNHEKLMELVLRHIGPVAVGLNGAKKSFMAYSGGIYNDVNCLGGADHALLIVGYGQKRDKLTGEKIKYWIARNSWGTGWGEHGYVRIQRGPHKKGFAGICGIASNPSVALGGRILDQQEVSLLRGTDLMDLEDPVYVYCTQKTSISHKMLCLQVGHWVYDHKVYLIGFSGVAVMLLTLWPLTRDCRRQQRLLQLRRQRRRLCQEQNEATNPGRNKNDGNPQVVLPTGETSPLLVHDHDDCHAQASPLPVPAP